MAFPVASRKADYVSPPRAFQASGPEGQVLAVTVGGAASYFQISSGVSQAVFDRTQGNDPTSMGRNYLTIECDVDLAIIFGKTAALVTGGNVPVIATVGTLSAGLYTGAAGTSFVIYAKIPMRFLMESGQDLFMGFIGASAGTMRIYQMSSDKA